jgi:hypothetical protein
MNNGDMTSMCCCEAPRAWFDLLIYAPGGVAGYRFGYFGGPLCWAGLKRTGADVVPFGLTTDGLNTTGSEIALVRTSTVGGASYNTWDDGEPAYRFDLQAELESLVNASDAYLDGSSRSFAWVEGMLDRDGAATFAILAGEVARSGGGSPYKRLLWCLLDATGEVTDSFPTATAPEVAAWNATPYNTNRPDRPWQGMPLLDTTTPGSSTYLSWSSEAIAWYGDGGLSETVIVLDATGHIYDRRTETATRVVTFATGGVDRYDVPGVDLKRVLPAGGAEETSHFVQTYAANTGPTSTTAYTSFSSGGSDGYLCGSTVEKPSRYYPRALIHSYDFSSSLISSDYAAMSPFAKCLASLPMREHSYGFGYREPSGRNGTIETVLNSYVSSYDAGAIPGFYTQAGAIAHDPSSGRYNPVFTFPYSFTVIHKLDGATVTADDVVGLAYECIHYDATESSDLAIYGKGGLKTIEVTNTSTYTPAGVPILDAVEITKTYESSPWYLRLVADGSDTERVLESDYFGLGSGPDNIFHLDDFGNFTTGGENLFAIDVSTSGGRHLRTLDMATTAYPGAGITYGHWTTAELHLFPGEPAAGEARLLLVYPWGDGDEVVGADLLFMSGVNTIIGVIRVQRPLIVTTGPPVTINGLTSQGVYFNGSFAFRDAKGTLAASAGTINRGTSSVGVSRTRRAWALGPLHPGGIPGQEALFELHRYDSEAGQTYVDPSLSTDAATDWVDVELP